MIMRTAFFATIFFFMSQTLNYKYIIMKSTNYQNLYYKLHTLSLSTYLIFMRTHILPQIKGYYYYKIQKFVISYIIRTLISDGELPPFPPSGHYINHNKKNHQQKSKAK